MALSRSTSIDNFFRGKRLQKHSFAIPSLWVWQLFSTFLLALSYATEPNIGPAPTTPQPWLTGTLLSPFGYVIEKGHINFEPYFYSNFMYGSYDKHWHRHSQPTLSSLSIQPFFWYGFANRWDIEIAPQFSWNHTSGASHWTLNDLPIELEYQLVSERSGKWQPAIKLAFLLTFPTGKYQKFNPKEKMTDRGGYGNWYPGLELVFQRLIHLSGMHFIEFHFTLGYTIPTSVHVKGFNAYGGGKHTHGTIYPGALFQTILGLEYTFTKNWAFAFDAQYNHNAHTHFKGHKGRTNGKLNSLSRPSSEQLSFAPAIEYNWSNNLGLIIGAWFSVTGHNSSAFANGIIAINLYK